MVRTSAGRRSPALGLLTVALTATVLGILIIYVDWHDVGARLLAVSPLHVLLSAILILATIWCRSRRLAVLFASHRGKPGEGLRLYGLALAHQAVFALLPSGSGDAVFPFLARHFVGERVSRSLAVVVTLRFQDVLTLIMFALAGSMALDTWSGPKLLAVAATALIAVTLMAWSGGLVGWVIQRAVFVAGSHGPSGLQRWLRGRISDEEVDALREAWADRRAPMVLWTVASWVFACLSLGFALAACGISVSAAQAAITLAFLNAAGALSVLTFAGLGVVDAGLAAALRWAGMVDSGLLSSVVTVRMVLLSLNIALPLLIAWLIHLMVMRAGGGRHGR